MASSVSDGWPLAHNLDPREGCCDSCVEVSAGWDAEPEGSALPPGNGDVVERVPPDLAQIRFVACRVNENCSGASGRESAERSVETDVVSHRANRGDVQHPALQGWPTGVACN